MYRVVVKTIVVLFLVFCGITTKSQEMLGLVTSNFAGSNGSIINPANLHASKLYMDINLMTFDFFVQNNYLYIHAKDYSFLEFFKRNPQFAEYGPDKYPFDYYDNTSLKNVYTQTVIRGPGFFQLNGRHAFGAYLGFRTLSSLRNVPYDLANFGYNSLSYEPQQNINYDDYDFYGNAVTFLELGVSYSYLIRRYGFDDISAGITLKGFLGYAGGYMYANNLDYTVVNDSTADIQNLNGEAAFSIPLDYNTGEFPGPGGNFRGNGLGVDLGVVYQRKVRIVTNRRINELCQQRYVDYDYKIGISLLDLGFVRFNKNAQKHGYDDVSRYWYNIDTISYYNMNQLAGDISTVFYGDPDASYRGDVFSVLLPAALSIQGDYHYYRNWYFAGVLVQPLVLGKASVTRPAQVAFIPRYETPEWEVALPVSLYEWRYPRIGASVRYRFLTLGTDKLAGFVGLTDFTGFDFYFSIKINFSQGKCLGARKFRPCDNWEYGVRQKR
jgi:hypothetical protein